MREILFRGQTANCKWVYGSLVHSKNIQPAIYFEVGKGTVKTFDFVYVKPETVGQFTGLTDKNGKMIFEGDKIKLTQGIGTVEWSKTQSRFMIWLPKSNKFASFLAGIEYEVIGNIHDKPELLEVTE